MGTEPPAAALSAAGLFESIGRTGDRADGRGPVASCAPGADVGARAGADTVAVGGRGVAAVTCARMSSVVAWCRDEAGLALGSGVAPLALVCDAVKLAGRVAPMLGGLDGAAPGTGVGAGQAWRWDRAGPACGGDEAGLACGRDGAGLACALDGA